MIGRLAGQHAGLHQSQAQSKVASYFDESLKSTTPKASPYSTKYGIFNTAQNMATLIQYKTWHLKYISTVLVRGIQ